MLPAGVSGASMTGEFYFPMTKRFTKGGGTELIASDFNTSLDSSVFSDLAMIETGFGMPPGTASIGESNVRFKYSGNIYKLTFGYGATENLTLGVKIPYWDIRNSVRTKVDSTNATVGLNPLFGSESDPFGSPIIPIAYGGTPMSTNDVQNLLGTGLPGIQGYGFRRVQNWSGSGLGDIELGGKYKYLDSFGWRLAFMGALRLPTGEIDDPDTLQDYSFGRDAYAILLRFYNDYYITPDLIIDLTLYYDIVLPNKRMLRVPSNADSPITHNKEYVTINQGDVFSIEPSISFTYGKLWNTAVVYTYSTKTSKDIVSGDKGYNYASLEDESRWEEQTYKISQTFSTIPLYTEKTFAVPLDIGLSYWSRFAGTNNLFKSEYLEAKLNLYF